MEVLTRGERMHCCKKLAKQKLMGFALLIMCVLLLWICCTGRTAEDRDGTALLLLAPLGLWMLFTKETVIY